MATKKQTGSRSGTKTTRSKSVQNNKANLKTRRVQENKTNVKTRRVQENKPSVKTRRVQDNKASLKTKKVVKTKRVIKNKKIIILLLSIIIVILLALIFICDNNKKTNDDGIVYNTNKSFIKEQNINGIVFKNIECTYDGKDSLISYTIKNNTGKKINLSNYDLIVKDKNNISITKIAANVTQEIDSNKEIKMVNSVVGVNLSDAYYMELKLKLDKVTNEKK